jgi:hypothetical protein
MEVILKSTILLLLLLFPVSHGDKHIALSTPSVIMISSWGELIWKARLEAKTLLKAASWVLAELVFKAKIQNPAVLLFLHKRAPRSLLTSHPMTRTLQADFEPAWDRLRSLASSSLKAS